jgi:hypothetical protein
MLGIKLGLDWGNNKMNMPPTIYTINLYGCVPGPPFVTYSISPDFAVGISLFTDNGLTVPVNATAGPVAGGAQYVITNGYVTAVTIACPS